MSDSRSGALEPRKACLHQTAFDAFGTSIRGRIAGATAVECCLALRSRWRSRPRDWSRPASILTGAAVFFGFGCLLGLMDVRRKRIAAGKAKAMPIWAILLAWLGGVAGVRGGDRGDLFPVRLVSLLRYSGGGL